MYKEMPVRDQEMMNVMKKGRWNAYDKTLAIKNEYQAKERSFWQKNEEKHKRLLQSLYKTPEARTIDDLDLPTEWKTELLDVFAEGVEIIRLRRLYEEAYRDFQKKDRTAPMTSRLPHFENTCYIATLFQALCCVGHHFVREATNDLVWSMIKSMRNPMVDVGKYKDVCEHIRNIVGNREGSRGRQQFDVDELLVELLELSPMFKHLMAFNTCNIVIDGDGNVLSRPQTQFQYAIRVTAEGKRYHAFKRHDWDCSVNYVSDFMKDSKSYHARQLARYHLTCKGHRWHRVEKPDSTNELRLKETALKEFEVASHVAIVADPITDVDIVKSGDKYFRAVATRNKILVVHVQRSDGFRRNSFKYPFEMTLLSHDLYSIIVQEGSVNAGHFIAYVRYGDHWWEMDDMASNVKRVDVQELKNLRSNVCLLFYVQTASVQK